MRVSFIRGPPCSLPSLQPGKSTDTRRHGYLLQNGLLRDELGTVGLQSAEKPEKMTRPDRTGAKPTRPLIGDAERAGSRRIDVEKPLFFDARVPANAGQGRVV